MPTRKRCVRATSLALTLALAAIVPPARSQTARLTFEVATIKPNIVGGGGSEQGTADQTVITNRSLKNLIERAYNVQPYQVIGPDWMDSLHFDVTAKYPPNTSPTDFRLMLRALLEDRFKFSAHNETRDIAGYGLVIAKGGLKIAPAKSDGEELDSRGGRIRTLTAKGISMAGLAAEMAEFLNEVVVDKTGLTGVYDLKLRWSKTDADNSADPDPAAPPTLFTALQETLGLRLDRQKVPVSIVVVDHTERVPIEN
jgi:uncharacterized protein (TIGR03435 family)